MGVRLKKKKARKTRTIFQIGEKKGRICFIIEVLSVNCLMVEKWKLEVEFTVEISSDSEMLVDFLWEIWRF